MSHKRLTANRLLTSWAVQLCDPSINSFDVGWKGVVAVTEHRWNKVTCSKCIRFGNNKTLLFDIRSVMNKAYKARN